MTYVLQDNSIKEYECPKCDGTGNQLEARLYPSGHTEVYVTCEFCDGEGYFAEADWLVLKLEGKA